MVDVLAISFHKMLQVAKKQEAIAEYGSIVALTYVAAQRHVYEAWLKLAGENVLHGQGIGFELFDENKIGQTNFVQNINYQRALQGELSRTISELPEVESARVHQ